MTPTDFQNATAERIAELFINGQRRVLLADEVGLGKTITAACALRLISDHYRKNLPGKDHFIVVYICSNINIAGQNAKKLGIEELLNVSESRLSMQHLRIFQNRGDDKAFEQLIPLTPATSFSMSSGCGTQEERALIFAILEKLPDFKKHTDKLCGFMAYEAQKKWRETVNFYRQKTKECESKNRDYFKTMVNGLEKQSDTAEILSKILMRCKDGKIEHNHEDKDLICALRRIFASISLEMLKPDFVIMDEFQRFPDLIKPHENDKDDEESMVVKRFLDDRQIKTLLISATPYKPYSTLQELDEDDVSQSHYSEFMRVMEYLLEDKDRINEFKTNWDNYSFALRELSKGDFSIITSAKTTAEKDLYGEICRTERENNSSVDDSGVCEAEISEGDTIAYGALQCFLDRTERLTGRRQLIKKVPIDYVKSSPYLLSFMEKYNIKEFINKHLNDINKKDLFKEKLAEYHLIKRSTIQNYRMIPYNNARLAQLMKILFADGKSKTECLLWVPPSRPYYKTAGIFNKNCGFSKLLLFSSWEMVPRMVSVMASYEAERLTIGRLYRSVSQKRGNGYFTQKNKKSVWGGKLTGDAEELLCTPSRFLADLYDPCKTIGSDLKQIKDRLEKKLLPRIEEITKRYSLTKKRGTPGAKTMIEIIKALDGEKAVPDSMPARACELLVNMAIASPAVCGLRLFNGNCTLARSLAEELFVSIFNKPESGAVIELLFRQKKGYSYYENVLKYCVDGNIQAVLDEYAHISDKNGEKLLSLMVDSNIESSVLKIDTLESMRNNTPDKKAGMRTHFAVGYYNRKIKQEEVQHFEKIRMAFNSPFRPFVLATTSIGQEGLDFHNYCRRVMHWNLPSNPTDIEQREGRVRRYKSLAVRQNIAKRYGSEKSWDDMFEKAVKTEKKNCSDIVPYWSLGQMEDNDYRIERVAPLYPFSLDRQKYERLIRVLSLYRLTLGQPRQEELIETL